MEYFLEWEIVISGLFSVTWRRELVVMIVIMGSVFAYCSIVTSFFGIGFALLRMSAMSGLGDIGL